MDGIQKCSVCGRERTLADANDYNLIQRTGARAMTDEELAEKVGYALYVERPLELDQEGGDDWEIMPDEWREEWVDAGRVAVAAVKRARRLTRPRKGASSGGSEHA